MLQHFQMNFGSFAGTALAVLQRVNAVDPTVLSRVRGVCWIVAAAFAGGKWSVSLSRSGVVLRNVRCPIRAERRVTNRRRCRAAAYLPSSLTFTLNSLLPFPAVALALSSLTLLAWLFAAVVVGGPTTNSRRCVCVCVRRVQTLILLFSNKNHTTNALLMLSSRPVYTLSSAARTGSATANPREVHSSEDVISSLSSGSCVSTSGYTHNTSLPW